MDKSTIAALVIGGLAFTAGVLRVVERYVHIAWHGLGQEQITVGTSPNTTTRGFNNTSSRL
jgi:hypothetical protein